MNNDERLKVVDRPAGNALGERRPAAATPKTGAGVWPNTPCECGHNMFWRSGSSDP